MDFKRHFWAEEIAMMMKSKNGLPRDPLAGFFCSSLVLYYFFLGIKRKLAKF